MKASELILLDDIFLMKLGFYREYNIETRMFEPEFIKQ